MVTQAIQDLRSLGVDGIPISRTILADINQLVRGNPILSTAILGAGVTGITAGVVRVTKRKKKRKATRSKRTKTTRRVRKHKKSTRRRKVTHRSPRHKGHKKVSFTTKDGKRVNFLVKKKCHTHKKLKRR